MFRDQVKSKKKSKDSYAPGATLSHSWISRPEMPKILNTHLLEPTKRGGFLILNAVSAHLV
jgi:hypothetical protein